MKAVGIDGCRGGWIAVWIEAAGRRGFEILPRIEDATRMNATMTMIDMPIGLPHSGYRACDLAARHLLGRGCARVFLGARRPLLDLRDDFDQANRWAKADGAGISRQLFGILPKIAEVDRFITASKGRQETFREAHPELIFQRLNRGVLPPGKKSDEGRALRRALIARHGFGDIDPWLNRLWGSGARADDLLDACACAIAAQDAAVSAGRKVDCAAEVDALGLRMEIWF